MNGANRWESKEFALLKEFEKELKKF